MGVFRRICALGKCSELRIVGGNKGFGITDSAYVNFTVPMWQEIRRHHEPFSGVMAWRTSDVMVGKVNETKRVHGLEVSGEFFEVLGVAPWQGRRFEPQDEAGCEITKVVASYPYWKSQMGARANSATPALHTSPPWAFAALGPKLY